MARPWRRFTEHPSTAAILTLSVTVGTWIVNFFGAVQGGWWERAAGYTPAAMVAEFQHGLVRLDTVLIALVLILTGLALAAIWMRLGIAVQPPGVRIDRHRPARGGRDFRVHVSATRVGTRRRAEATRSPRPTNRRSGRSTRRCASRRIWRRRIRGGSIWSITRFRSCGASCRSCRCEYVSATSIGLFEQTSAGYGEIWYELGGRRTMSRVTTAEGVLEAIYSLAGVTPPQETDEAIFRGHPLAVPPTGAGCDILWCLARR